MNVKYVKKVEKGFLNTAVDYQLDAAASEADLGQDPGEAGRGESHMIGIGMLVVSLRGVNFTFRSLLGCFRSLIGLRAKKY